MKTSDEILSEPFQVLRQVHDAVEEKRELNACFVFSKLGSLAPPNFPKKSTIQTTAPIIENHIFDCKPAAQPGKEEETERHNSAVRRDGRVLL